jgi:hypothetical protein
MAHNIPSKPKPRDEQREASKFIGAANKSKKKQPYSTTLRIPQDLLDRIDRAAAKEHITRSGWIKSSLSKLLDEKQIL